MSFEQTYFNYRALTQNSQAKNSKVRAKHLDDGLSNKNNIFAKMLRPYEFVLIVLWRADRIRFDQAVEFILGPILGMVSDRRYG